MRSDTNDLPLVSPEDQRAGIVIQTGQRHAPEMSAGPFMPVQQGAQPFMGIRPNPQPPGVPQREHQEVGSLPAFANPHVELDCDSHISTPHQCESEIFYVDQKR